MALSGTFYGSWLGAGYQRVYLNWSATQNITNNTSTITASLIWQNTSASSLSSSTLKNVNIVIAGETFNSTANITIGGSTTKTLMTASKTVAHGSAGDLSTSISGLFELKFTLGGTYYASTSASGTAVLDTIPRASLITGFSDFTIGSGITVTAGRASTGFTNTFVMKVGSTTIYTKDKLAADSYVFTSGDLDSIYALIPNNTSVTATVYVTTYSGTTQIGDTQSRSATASVGIGIVPTLSGVTAVETIASVGTLGLGINTFIQNLSKIKFDIQGATGVKSSPIVSYKISFNGVDYSNSTATVVTTGLIGTAGNITATATVEDSRGRISSITRTVICSLLEYSAPRITTFSATRQATASTVLLNLIASTSSLNNLNQLTYIIKSKDRTLTSYTTITASTSLAVGIEDLVLTPSYLNYDIAKSYDFQVIITDKVGGTSTANVLISTEQVAMSWGKTGIGAGKVYEQGALDVGGDIYQNGTIIYSIIESGSNTNGSYVKYGDGTMICWQSLGTNLAVNTVIGNLYKSAEITWTFPIAFYAAPTVTLGVIANSGYPFWTSTTINYSSNCRYVMVTNNTFAAFAQTQNRYAIGRWKA